MKYAFRFFIPVLLLFLLWIPNYFVAATSPSLQNEGGRTVLFDVGEKSWIRVLVNNTEQFTGTMKSKSSGPWSGEDIVLETDNAGAVSLTLDGRSLGPLGALGEGVKRRWQANGQDVPLATAIASLEATPLVVDATEVATPITPSAVETISPTVTAIPPVEVVTPTVEVTPSVAEGDASAYPAPTPPPASDAPIEGTLMDRMTETAKNVPTDSPYHNTTWVTYYGRPNIAVMGILGAHSVDELMPILWQQVNRYDEANGPELAVMPALHLVYGMATKLPGEDGDHLAFLTDEVVMEYIQAAQREGIAVILDIQIGKLTPVEAIRYGLPYLQYGNVHLAIDPEFAMTEPDQERPGNPIGFVTAQQVNEVQAVMQEYMNANNIQGSRILLLHQFLEQMIVNKDQFQRYPKIDLTTTADGWGPPKGKIEKYNGFMTQKSFFTGFKLFYEWDNPVMTERQALGLDLGGENRMEITPNLIIYQ